MTIDGFVAKIGAFALAGGLAVGAAAGFATVGSAESAPKPPAKRTGAAAKAGTAPKVKVGTAPAAATQARVRNAAVAQEVVFIDSGRWANDTTDLSLLREIEPGIAWGDAYAGVDVIWPKSSEGGTLVLRGVSDAPITFCLAVVGHGEIRFATLDGDVPCPDASGAMRGWKTGSW